MITGPMTIEMRDYCINITLLINIIITMKNFQSYSETPQLDSKNRWEFEK